MSEFFFNLNAEKGFQTMIQNLEVIKQNTGISYCTSQIVVFFFLIVFCFTNWRVCDNSTRSWSLSAIFPTASAHFMSLCHILVSYHISNFSVFVMVIWDRWPSMILLWLLSGATNHAIWSDEPNRHILCAFCVLRAPLIRDSHLSLSSGFSVLRHSNIETRPINNPKRTSKCSSERKSLSTHQA